MNKTTISALVIDDDELTRIGCQKLLTGEGITVYNAANGVSGMQAFRTKKPDIVIVDILMPEKEGLETITEMRALRRSVPIIAISGGGCTSNMTFLKMALKIGASATLEKPLKPANLLKMIHHYIESTP